MSDDNITDFSSLEEKIKTADVEDINRILDNLDGDDIGDEGHEMHNVYTSIPNSDYLWLEGLASHFGTSKSFIVKRIIYNARVRDAFDEKELI